MSNEVMNAVRGLGPPHVSSRPVEVRHRDLPEAGGIQRLFAGLHGVLSYRSYGEERLLIADIHGNGPARGTLQDCHVIEGDQVVWSHGVYRPS